MEATPPDPGDSVGGLRAWIAQLDRTLGVRTYLLGALTLLALAAGVVALVLVLRLEGDSATEEDVATLSEQVSTVEDQATEAAESRVQSVEGRIAELERKIDDLTSDQETLKRRLNKLEEDVGTQPSGGTGTGTGGSGSSATGGAGSTADTGAGGSSGGGSGGSGEGSGGTSATGG
jgi:TolA-binding protein